MYLNENDPQKLIGNDTIRCGFVGSRYSLVLESVLQGVVENRL